jgi:hypothetical protein
MITTNPQHCPQNHACPAVRNCPLLDPKRACRSERSGFG